MKYDHFRREDYLYLPYIQSFVANAKSLCSWYLAEIMSVRYYC